MESEIKWLLVICLSSLLLGCQGISENSNLEKPQNNIAPSTISDIQPAQSQVIQMQIKTITISGVNEIQEISNSNPISLYVSGSKNKITINKGTNVTKIVLSGSDNIIKLPEGASPEIDKSGVNNQIGYY